MGRIHLAFSFPRLPPTDRVAARPALVYRFVSYGSCVTESSYAVCAVSPGPQGLAACPPHGYGRGPLWTSRSFLAFIALFSLNKPKNARNAVPACPMLLSDLLLHVPCNVVRGSVSRTVGPVERDTRRLRPGGVFVAIVGTRIDGHTLLSDPAIAACAAIVVQDGAVSVTEDWPPGPTVISVPDSSAALGPLCAARAGFPSASLPVVAVTGTNGKTTVTTLLGQALASIGLGAGQIGTLGAWLWAVGDQHGRPQRLPSDLTTPDPPRLQPVLRHLADAGVVCAALEASSIGLDQNRLAATQVHTAVFTNLGHDHLDVHGTMAAYAAAKSRLFTQHLRPAGGAPRAVLCGDDPHWTDMAPPADRWLYGLGAHCEVRAVDVVLDPAGVSASVHTPLGTTALRSQLVGKHNLLNLLGALAAGLTLGIDLHALASALGKAQGARGRMEQVSPPEGVQSHGRRVWVDYAHTPDALSAALASARSGSEGRTLVVFGCGGDRDRGKRPEMAKVACAADVVVLTSDNPRTEDPERILDDIVAGIDASRAQGTVHREVDRKAAIRWAVGAAGPGDGVLVAGKGHESTQTIGNQVVPFDDAVEVRAAMEVLWS